MRGERDAGREPRDERPYVLPGDPAAPEPHEDEEDGRDDDGGRLREEGEDEEKEPEIR